MSDLSNLLAVNSNNAQSELVQELARSSHVRIERIVSTGQASPDGFWYDQDEVEWVAVLAGDAVLQFEDGETLTMRPGDFVTIDAHRKHRVVSTSEEVPTIWLAVFF